MATNSPSRLANSGFRIPAHPLARIAGSFVLMLVAYSAYAVMVVPLVEPAADPRPEEAALAQGMPAVPPPSAPDDLKDLFPPGAWELKDPKVLESEQVRLLMRDYHNRPDGQVEIIPCTVVYLPDGAAGDVAQKQSKSVILEAPEGAVLVFDKPLDLRRAKIGRLVGGTLRGPITIRNAQRLPDGDYSLKITSRDVQLQDMLVSSPHPLEFRWGANFGRGRQMAIKLLPRKTDRPDATGLNIAGIESFEVKSVERLHLDLPAPAPKNAGRLAPALVPGGRPAQVPGLNGRAAREESLSLDITCRGPFRFNMIQQTATFADHVDVLRHQPQGPSDQLNCELLTVTFAPRPSKPDVPPAAFDLQPRKLEARGHPVLVSAPSEDVHARGSRLEYDLATNRVTLDAVDEAFLQRGPNEIHAKSLQYQAAGPGRLGQVVAEGPGWFRGQMAERPEDQLEARWKGQLLVRPYEQNQVISLTGGAGLKFRELGRLDAQEIHFWLREGPPMAGQPRLRPDRMLARGEVRLDSPQLASAVEQLEIWFENRGGIAKTEDGQWRGENGSAPPAAPPLAANPGPAGQHFEITGRLLRARVTMQGRQTSLSELTIEEGARFAETQTAQPGEKPMTVTGDRLFVADADKPQAVVKVTGRPAHFEGRGLGMTGTNINLSRGDNRLWIEGPGQMDLPVDRSPDGQPLAKPTTLKVQWQSGMAFDGRIARFAQSVTAATPDQTMRTEVLEVELHDPIRFAEPKMQGQPQVEQIRCMQGVWVDGRTRVGEQVVSRERMQLADLAVNLQSGELNAGGPGWMTRVSQGSGDPRLRLSSEARSAPPAKPQADAGLRCLRVRFQGSITGNVHRREATFHDQVQVAYAPTDSWDTTLPDDTPEALGPKGVTMRCDHLRVNQMPSAVGNRQSVELEAAGNTVVEGNAFTARAIRLTYAEEKDMLVLEGDGRTDAELFRQQIVGGPMSKAAARKIFYWPSTNRLKVDGAKSLELSQFSKEPPP